MSHITELQIQADAPVDLDALRLAAEMTGGEFREGQTTYACYPESGMNDTEPPPWLVPGQWGKCEHALHYPGCEYEVGVVRVADEWRLVWDDWSPGGLLHRLGGRKAPVLTEAVRKAAAVVRDQRAVERVARSLGGRVVREKLPGHGVKLRIEVRA